MKKNKIETEVPEQRYTSYHSDKTFSILERARRDIKERSCFFFEFNGKYYTVELLFPTSGNTWGVIAHGLMYKYLMPWSGGEGPRKTLAEFDGEKFDEFIETFEIEGKTVRWILEHQKEWKYNLTAEHFEKVLTGFSFYFICRGIPCQIYYSGTGHPQPTDGRYISLLHGVRFDPSQYAPTIPGAKHWFDVSWNLDVFDTYQPPVGCGCPVPREGAVRIAVGPFKTDGALLDTIRLNDKTLREIFDTEYDDGVVFCGMFEG